MPRIARIGWLLALSLAASSAVAQAAPERASPPVVHTTVTLPTRPVARRAPAQRTAPVSLIVTFAHADASAAHRAHAAAGATAIATSARGRVHVVHVEPAHRDAALATYRQQAGVASVSVDRRTSVSEVPSDPLYATATSGGGTQVSTVAAPDALPALPAPTTDPTIVAGAALAEGQ
ncbi:MAG: hypothetical protein E6I75_08380 [Chloroflexi bacterium]|nr:MAG: hypothetical protein E6I75_08380 [Chloroflexota bacterium]